MAFDPLNDIAWHTAFWAEDPNWTDPGDGNAVSQWDDASGNGRHATQATASKQPTYRSSVSAFSNQPAVQGDGTDDTVRTSSFTAVSQPTTIVAVASAVVGDDADPAIVDGYESTNRQHIWRSPGNGWSIYAGAIQRGGTTDADPHLFIATFDSTDTLEVDGTTVVSADAGGHSLTALRLFANQGEANANAGHIAFVGFLDRVLTAGEKDGLEEWAAAHYNFAVGDWPAGGRWATSGSPMVMG